jgi:hypothetical protein
VKQLWRDYGLSITLALLFLGSWALQTWMGWVEFVSEQAAHGQQAEAFGDGGYFWRWGQATFENWQSEFLQLLWQVVGLAYFLYLGSPASKENDDRLELKVDALLRAVGGERAEDVIANIDREFGRADGHEPHKHGTEIAKKAGQEIAGVAAKA